MSNYDKMIADARRRFTNYDMTALAKRPGVADLGEALCTTFLGEPVLAEKATGQMTVGGRVSDFGETLCIFDWLCDSKPDAAASNEFCTVGSLPGIFVSGSGLTMKCDALAAQIDENPEKFLAACEALDGKKINLGDIGFQIPVFPNLDMQLKFYRADEDFSATLTFLWDRNTLRFIRYETVYYLAGCLRQRLEGPPQQKAPLRKRAFPGYIQPRGLI